MLRDITKVIIRFFIGFFILIFLLIGIISILEKHLLYQIASPDGSLKVLVFWNLSEGGAAPYGYHVSLSRWYVPSKLSFNSPFFAGYCRERPEIEWLNSQSIKLSCSLTREPVLRSEFISGVEVSYSLIDEDSLS